MHMLTTDLSTNSYFRLTNLFIRFFIHIVLIPLH